MHVTLTVVLDSNQDPIPEMCPTWKSCQRANSEVSDLHRPTACSWPTSEDHDEGRAPVAGAWWGFAAQWHSAEHPVHETFSSPFCPCPTLEPLFFILWKAELLSFMEEVYTARYNQALGLGSTRLASAVTCLDGCL